MTFLRPVVISVFLGEAGGGIADIHPLASTGDHQRRDYGAADIASFDHTMRIDRRDAREGIAASAALGYAPMPSEPGRTSYVLNGTLFRDQQAVGGSIAHRLNTGAPSAITAGFAYGGHSNNLAHVGVAGEF